ncbi:MAG: hypothetical protein KIH44_000495 [Octadecabacter sp.]|nr:hypothetical protein [Octadecabacter sp.]
MDELQKSELVISKIVTLVSGWGIQSTRLEFEELELEDSFAPFFIPCVEWLEAEGVLRTKNILEYSNGGCVVRPVLTSYGMRILGTEISLDGEKTKLATAAAKVSSGEKSYSQFGDFVGGILGGFTKSIGS